MNSVVGRDERTTDCADGTDEKITESTEGIAMRPGMVQQFGQSEKSGSIEKVRNPQTYAVIGAAMEVPQEGADDQP